MSEFQVYFQIGLGHILDLAGYDHILFVLTLCLAYPLSNWKRILWLLTAFTIGHSISLAFTITQAFEPIGPVVESLIAATILITALINLATPEQKSHAVNKQSPLPRYVLATGFGLIHGLGFSGYLSSLLGKEADITWPLISFNLGLELGQAVIAALYFVLLFLVLRLTPVRMRPFFIGASGFAAGMAFCMLIDRIKLIQF